MRSSHPRMTYFLAYIVRNMAAIRRAITPNTKSMKVTIVSISLPPPDDVPPCNNAVVVTDAESLLEEFWDWAVRVSLSVLPFSASRGISTDATTSALSPDSRVRDCLSSDAVHPEFNEREYVSFKSPVFLTVKV